MTKVHPTIEKMAKAAFEANSGPWEFCSEDGKQAMYREAKAAAHALLTSPLSIEASVSGTEAWQLQAAMEDRTDQIWGTVALSLLKEMGA